MYNWSTDEKKFEREDSEGYRLWRLKQLINYGLAGEKLSKKEIKKYWPKLKEMIDPEERMLIEFFLWGKPYSGQARKFFWEK